MNNVPISSSFTFHARLVFSLRSDVFRNIAQMRRNSEGILFRKRVLFKNFPLQYDCTDYLPSSTSHAVKHPRARNILGFPSRVTTTKHSSLEKENLLYGSGLCSKFSFFLYILIATFQRKAWPALEKSLIALDMCTFQQCRPSIIKR